VYIDQHITWKIHLETVAFKISKNIGIISRIAYLIPTNVRLNLYYSLIYPYSVPQYHLVLQLQESIIQTKNPPKMKRT